MPRRTRANTVVKSRRRVKFVASLAPLRPSHEAFLLRFVPVFTFFMPHFHTCEAESSLEQLLKRRCDRSASLPPDRLGRRGRRGHRTA